MLNKLVYTIWVLAEWVITLLIYALKFIVEVLIFLILCYFKLKCVDIIENRFWVMILSKIWVRIKIIYNIDKSEKEEEDTKEIDIRYRHYLIPFFFLKVLLDKKRRKRVCKKYILLLIGNILITVILVALFVYSEIPKSTTSQLTF